MREWQRCLAYSRHHSSNARSPLRQLHAQLSNFFFSSRRRHTRWPRDWSSDVCSSDLHVETGSPGSTWAPHLSCWKRSCRSEERRVGKECRSRWERDHEKKKQNIGIGTEREYVSGNCERLEPSLAVTRARAYDRLLGSR